MQNLLSAIDQAAGAVIAPRLRALQELLGRLKETHDTEPDYESALTAIMDGADVETVIDGLLADEDRIEQAARRSAVKRSAALLAKDEADKLQRAVAEGVASVHSLANAVLRLADQTKLLRISGKEVSLQTKTLDATIERLKQETIALGVGKEGQALLDHLQGIVAESLAVRRAAA